MANTPRPWSSRKYGQALGEMGFRYLEWRRKVAHPETELPRVLDDRVLLSRDVLQSFRHQAEVGGGAAAQNEEDRGKLMSINYQ